VKISDQTQLRPVEEIGIQLHPKDHVVIARIDLNAGQMIEISGKSILIRDSIPAGHKFALVDIPEGGEVRRYGQVIGFARETILAGNHVHTHNLGVGELKRMDDISVTRVSFPSLPEKDRLTFMGFKRYGRRAGTRNYIAVISTVNCSAHAVQAIASHFTCERLAAFPNVDGVISFTHPHGCGVEIGGLNYMLLQRTLAGMASHPNVAASILVGLGCETNQASELVQIQGLDEFESYAGTYVIQDLGGTRKTIEAGIEKINQLLPEANSFERQPVPVSELAVALQCGGSDGWSGISANPLVGWVSDEIVRHGGTVLLAETPEIFGAEHLLTARTSNPLVSSKLLDQVRWWQSHTRQLGIDMDTNRSPGNAAGGLTTIYEKALGAVAKGGSSPLQAVYGYAEQVTNQGLAFMNTPGNDSISVTGQVAGGCNLVLFTTGRGSVFGFKPAPSIKISTNSALFKRMPDDIDYNSGKLLEGTSVGIATKELLDLVIETASGSLTKSEALGIGEMEFNPWFLGGVM